MDLRTTVDRYLAFWNESSSERRDDLLREVFAPNASYQGPLLAGVHHDGIRKASGQLKEHLPDHRFLCNGTVDIYQRAVRLPWAIIAPDGERVFATGVDFGTFDDDGRLKSITAFLDLWPEGVENPHLPRTT